MLNHIDGKLVEKTPTHAVIDCGGVGYLLNISLNTFSKMPDSGNCKLLTYLAIREDAHVLYGFIDEAERILFKHLISVNGVGASTARVMLSSLNPTEIHEAIASGNANTLQRIKGIGAKSALRLIVELKDKLSKLGSFEDFSSALGSVQKTEALSALQALGFAKPAAEKAIDKASKTMAGEMSVEQLIKTALKFL
ncbi:MAG: Holliday junction branch migration protein RuvA [Bacteroidia bacterium]|nr:Holliday junction branch migration protein RuvA [Bacteroidia bacterium]